MTDVKTADIVFPFNGCIYCICYHRIAMQTMSAHWE